MREARDNRLLLVTAALWCKAYVRTVGGLWHEVEVFCPVCQQWRSTGAATTAENMERDTPLVQWGDAQGRVRLLCGHEVTPGSKKTRMRP